MVHWHWSSKQGTMALSSGTVPLPKGKMTHWHCILTLWLCIVQVVAPESPSEEAMGGDSWVRDLNSTEFGQDSNITDYAENVTLPDYVDDNVTATLSTDVTTTVTTPTTTTSTATTPSDTEESELVVDDFCLCDLKVMHCDVNCCCDEDCSDEDRKVFSHCLTRPSPTLDHRYCVQKNLIFSNHTEYRVERDQGGLTCIMTDNLPQRTIHIPVQGARNTEEFLVLEKSQLWYQWPKAVSAGGFVAAPYTAGSPIWAYTMEGQVVAMGLPISIIGSECEASSELQYLQGFQSTCMRILKNFQEQCQEGGSLDAFPYLALEVVADPGSVLENSSSTDDPDTTEPTTTSALQSTTDPTITVLQSTTEPTTIDATTTTITLPQSSTEPLGTQTPLENQPGVTRPSPPDLQEVGFLRVLPIMPYLCHVDDQGVESCTLTSVESLPRPVYANHTCWNVTQDVQYVFTHNGTAGIVEVHGRVRLGSVTAAVGGTVMQGFSTQFVWVSQEAGDVFVRSGRPGYITGKPLLMGRLVHNVTDEGEVMSAIALDTDPTHWLTLLSPGPGSHCTSRSPVNFGMEVRSGCVLEVTQADLRDCATLKSQVRALLLGPELSTHPEALRVGTYGDASVNSAGDWVPILVPEVDTTSDGSSSLDECHDVSLSMHLEIAYSLQGALANPQAKVVGVMLRHGVPQTIMAPCPTCGNTLTLELASSVAFVEVTSPPQPVYAKPPALDIKLPYDFFYPFLPSKGCGLPGGGQWWWLCWWSCVSCWLMNLMHF